MLKKLQRKFMLIILACVMSVIFTVLMIFIFININQYRNSTRDIMKSELYFFINEFSDSQGEEPRFFKNPPEMGFEKDIHEGYYYVCLDKNGNIKQKLNNTGENDTLKYESILRTIQKDESVFSANLEGFRYFKLDMNEETYLVLSTNTEDTNYFLRLFVLSFVIFFLSFAAFFAISLYLSGFVLKPVKKAWEEQERFVADASHELRTPISILLANMNILKDNKEDTVKGQFKWIESSTTEALRMQRLVESLLLLAKSDNQSLVFKLEDLDLTKLVEERVLSFEALAFEKKIDFSYELEEKCILRSDAESLKQILNILIDNAFKYCEGDKRVFIKVSKKSGNISFEVESSGTPIPEDVAGKLFDRFYRADKERSRDKGGYGLGLAIAYTLCRQLDARIGVRTSEAGNTFWVELSGNKKA